MVKYSRGKGRLVTLWSSGCPSIKWGHGSATVWGSGRWSGFPEMCRGVIKEIGVGGFPLPSK